MSIEEITKQLGEAYRGWKDNEIEKNRLKEEFFDLASRSFDRQDRATKVVHCGDVGNAQAAREFALKQNPFWKIIGIHMQDDLYWVGMEEDVTLKPFAFVNKEDGMVYQRTVVEGPVLLDDERMKAENPELWQAISREKTVVEVIPFEELDPEVLEQLSGYLYQGQPTVKFLAPRPAREDELGE